jgi:hypothetical protein
MTGAGSKSGWESFRSDTYAYSSQKKQQGFGFSPNMISPCDDYNVRYLGKKTVTAIERSASFPKDSNRNPPSPFDTTNPPTHAAYFYYNRETPDDAPSRSIQRIEYNTVSEEQSMNGRQRPSCRSGQEDPLLPGRRRRMYPVFVNIFSGRLL